MQAIPERTLILTRGFTVKKAYASTRFETTNIYSAPIFDKSGTQIASFQVFVATGLITMRIHKSVFQNWASGTYYGFLKETIPNANPLLDDDNKLIDFKLILNEETPR